MDPDDWKLMSKEKVFFIANHHYEIDWVITIAFTDKLDTLGYCRAFIKKMLEFVPVVGWFWKLSDYIALERSFEKDREAITQRLGEILQTSCPIMVRNLLVSVYRSLKVKFLINFQVLFFAEGTRLTQEKLKNSIKYAEERNLKPLKYHLFPRTKGFKVCLPMIKKNCDSLVNYEMLFEEDKKDVTVVNLLKGKKFNCHSFIKRIPISELPDDENDVDDFMYKEYQEKDKWAESFFKNKNFLEVSKWKPVEYKSRWWVLINQIFWMTVVVTPIIVHFVNLLNLGLYYNFLIKFGIIYAIGECFWGQSCFLALAQRDL